MRQNAAIAYKTQQVLTASPAVLVAMLYERAIRALREAVRAGEAGNIQERFNQVQHAIDIVTHLWGTLDEKKGGEIASNLGNLYRFMLRRINDVNVRNDLQAARDVIGLLEPLAASWREIASQTAPAPAAASGARPAFSAVSA